MKLWSARSNSYRTHFFSALCRSLYTNSCWIFATSLFIKVVGSKGYSQLYFFASLCALIYYIYFAFRGHNDKEPYNVYKAVLAVALLASVSCFLEPHLALLAPFNELLLYFFVVSVMTVDLIGIDAGTDGFASISKSGYFPPGLSKDNHSGIGGQDNCSSTGLAFLSQGHLLQYLYPFAWSMLIAHFILFDITIWRMRVSELKTRIADEDKTAGNGNSLRIGAICFCQSIGASGDEHNGLGNGL